MVRDVMMMVMVAVLLGQGELKGSSSHNWGINLLIDLRLNSLVRYRLVFNTHIAK
jgi:hypothetical protein